MTGTTDKIKLDSGETQRKIYIVKDSSAYVIRETVTKHGYYIVWPGRFPSPESCQEEVNRELAFASAK